MPQSSRRLWSATYSPTWPSGNSPPCRRLAWSCPEFTRKSSPGSARAASPPRGRPSVLPAGRYATLPHTGHPDGLADATASLLSWAAEQGLAWDVTETSDGERWEARLEIYETDPAQEPDMTRWQTQLAFRLAD
jgi:GyrI-like small molecule binding domain